jgi:hypothetical protein
MREWYGAFPDCGPLAKDSAAKLKRSVRVLCTMYSSTPPPARARLAEMVPDWLAISVSS